MWVLLVGQYPISLRITLGFPNKLSRVKKIGILFIPIASICNSRNPTSLQVTLGFPNKPSWINNYSNLQYDATIESGVINC